MYIITNMYTHTYTHAHKVQRGTHTHTHTTRTRARATKRAHLDFFLPAAMVAMVATPTNLVTAPHGCYAVRVPRRRQNLFCFGGCDVCVCAIHT